MVIAIGEFLKNMPKYITKKPAKIKLSANVRILLILLEYFLAIVTPPNANYILYILKNKSICLLIKAILTEFLIPFKGEGIYYFIVENSRLENS